MTDDLISRQAVKEQMIKYGFHALDMTVTEFVEDLSSVNPQEPSKDMEEISEIMRCDADAETKCKMISNILTAKPHYFEEQEPKTGHWISHREHCENLGVISSGLGAYKWCSNCDCGIDVREWRKNNYNYCPNCGFRMIGPQKSEE